MTKLVESEHFQIIKEFKSKKNQVYLVKNHSESDETGLAVLKRFESDGREEIRWLEYLKAQGLAVPGIIVQEADQLLLEYLSGQTLCDYFQEQEMRGESVGELARVLATFYGWLSEFYGLVRVNRNVIFEDVNLRNFIVHESGKIYGLDFEDCVEGEMEEDAGRICAFALTYRPAFTEWKHALVQELFNGLVRELGLNQKRTFTAFIRELQAIGERRRMEIPAILAQDYLVADGNLVLEILG